MSASLQSRLDKLTDALIAGRITLDEWREAVEHELPTSQQQTVEQIAQQYASGSLTADALKRAVDALTATPTSAADTAGQIALTAGTLAFFTALFAKARSGAAIKVPRIEDAILSRYEAFYSQRIDQLQGALFSGKINVQEWQDAFNAEIADIHSTFYAAGKGGFANLDSADLKLINDKVLDQQRYVDAWAAQLQQASESPSLAALQARGQLYLSAANNTLQTAVVDALGLPVRLPVMPGELSDCLVHCRCYWRIDALAGDQNWDCTWVVDHLAEHCDQCERRGEVWNPLKIRAGRILDYPDTGLYAA